MHATAGWPHDSCGNKFIAIILYDLKTALSRDFALGITGIVRSSQNLKIPISNPPDHITSHAYDCCQKKHFKIKFQVLY